MTSIGAELVAHVRPHGSSGTVRTAAVLVWDTRDPLAVTITFPEAPMATPWVLYRGDLADGLHATTGLSDVFVEPDPTNPDNVVVTFVSPYGRADVYLDRLDVRVFLARTFERQPLGGERLDIPDTVPAEWLTGEGSIQ